MHLTYTYKDEKKEADVSATTVKEVVQELGIQFNTVIVVKEGRLMLAEETLADNDTVQILTVVSGG